MKENDVALLTRSPRRNKELRTAFSHAPLKSNKLKFFRREGVEAASIIFTKFEKNRLLPFSVLPTLPPFICNFDKVMKAAFINHLFHFHFYPFLVRKWHKLATLPNAVLL